MQTTRHCVWLNSSVLNAMHMCLTCIGCLIQHLAHDLAGVLLWCLLWWLLRLYGCRAAHNRSAVLLLVLVWRCESRASVV